MVMCAYATDHPRCLCNFVTYPEYIHANSSCWNAVDNVPRS